MKMQRRGNGKSATDNTDDSGRIEVASSDSKEHRDVPVDFAAQERYRYSMNYQSYEATRIQPAEQTRRMLDYMFQGYQKRDPRNWYEMQTQTDLGGKGVEALIGTELVESETVELEERRKSWKETFFEDEELVLEEKKDVMKREQKRSVSRNAWEGPPIKIVGRSSDEGLSLLIDDYYHTPKSVLVPKEVLEKQSLKVDIVPDEEGIPKVVIYLGEKEEEEEKKQEVDEEEEEDEEEDVKPKAFKTLRTSIAEGENTDKSPVFQWFNDQDLVDSDENSRKETLPSSRELSDLKSETFTMLPDSLEKITEGISHTNVEHDSSELKKEDDDGSVEAGMQDYVGPTNSIFLEPLKSTGSHLDVEEYVIPVAEDQPSSEAVTTKPEALPLVGQKNVVESMPRELDEVGSSITIIDDTMESLVEDTSPQSPSPPAEEPHTQLFDEPLSPPNEETLNPLLEVLDTNTEPSLEELAAETPLEPTISEEHSHVTLVQTPSDGKDTAALQENTPTSTSLETPSVDLIFAPVDNYPKGFHDETSPELSPPRKAKSISRESPDESEPDHPLMLTDDYPTKYESPTDEREPSGVSDWLENNIISKAQVRDKQTPTKIPQILGKVETSSSILKVGEGSSKPTAMKAPQTSFNTDPSSSYSKEREDSPTPVPSRAQQTSLKAVTPSSQLRNEEGSPKPTPMKATHYSKADTPSSYLKNREESPMPTPMKAPQTLFKTDPSSNYREESPMPTPMKAPQTSFKTDPSSNNREESPMPTPIKAPLTSSRTDTPGSSGIEDRKDSPRQTPSEAPQASSEDSPRRFGSPLSTGSPQPVDEINEWLDEEVIIPAAAETWLDDKIFNPIEKKIESPKDLPQKPSQLKDEHKSLIPEAEASMGSTKDTKAFVEIDEAPTDKAKPPPKKLTLLCPSDDDKKPPDFDQENETEKWVDDEILIPAEAQRWVERQVMHPGAKQVEADRLESWLDKEILEPAKAEKRHGETVGKPIQVDEPSQYSLVTPHIEAPKTVEHPIPNQREVTPVIEPDRVDSWLSKEILTPVEEMARKRDTEKHLPQDHQIVEEKLSEKIPSLQEPLDIHEAHCASPFQPFADSPSVVEPEPPLIKMEAEPVKSEPSSPPPQVISESVRSSLSSGGSTKRRSILKLSESSPTEITPGKLSSELKKRDSSRTSTLMKKALEADNYLLRDEARDFVTAHKKKSSSGSFSKLACPLGGLFKKRKSSGENASPFSFKKSQSLTNSDKLIRKSVSPGSVRSHLDEMKQPLSPVQEVDINVDDKETPQQDSPLPSHDRGTALPAKAIHRVDEFIELPTTGRPASHSPVHRIDTKGDLVKVPSSSELPPTGKVQEAPQIKGDVMRPAADVGAKGMPSMEPPAESLPSTPKRRSWNSPDELLTKGFPKFQDFASLGKPKDDALEKATAEQTRVPDPPRRGFPVFPDYQELVTHSKEGKQHEDEKDMCATGRSQEQISPSLETSATHQEVPEPVDDIVKAESKAVSINEKDVLQQKSATDDKDTPTKVPSVVLSSKKTSDYPEELKASESLSTDKDHLSPSSITVRYKSESPSFTNGDKGLTVIKKEPLDISQDPIAPFTSSSYSSVHSKIMVPRFLDYYERKDSLEDAGIDHHPQPEGFALEARPPSSLSHLTPHKGYAAPEQSPQKPKYFHEALHRTDSSKFRPVPIISRPQSGEHFPQQIGHPTLPYDDRYYSTVHPPQQAPAHGMYPVTQPQHLTQINQMPPGYYLPEQPSFGTHPVTGPVSSQQAGYNSESLPQYSGGSPQAPSFNQGAVPLQPRQHYPQSHPTSFPQFQSVQPSTSTPLHSHPSYPQGPVLQSHQPYSPANTPLLYTPAHPYATHDPAQSSKLPQTTLPQTHQTPYHKPEFQHPNYLSSGLSQTQSQPLPQPSHSKMLQASDISAKSEESTRTGEHTKEYSKPEKPRPGLPRFPDYDELVKGTGDQIDEEPPAEQSASSESKIITAADKIKELNEQFAPIRQQIKQLKTQMYQLTPTRGPPMRSGPGPAFTSNLPTSLALYNEFERRAVSATKPYRNEMLAQERKKRYEEEGRRKVQRAIERSKATEISQHQRYL